MSAAGRDAQAAAVAWGLSRADALLPSSSAAGDAAAAAPQSVEELRREALLCSGIAGPRGAVVLAALDAAETTEAAQRVVKFATTDGKPSWVLAAAPMRSAAEVLLAGFCDLSLLHSPQDGGSGGGDVGSAARLALSLDVLAQQHPVAAVNAARKLCNAWCAAVMQGVEDDAGASRRGGGRAVKRRRSDSVASEEPDDSGLAGEVLEAVGGRERLSTAAATLHALARCPHVLRVVVGDVLRHPLFSVDVINRIAAAYACIPSAATKRGRNPGGDIVEASPCAAVFSALRDLMTRRVSEVALHSVQLMRVLHDIRCIERSESGVTEQLVREAAETQDTWVRLVAALPDDSPSLALLFDLLPELGSECVARGAISDGLPADWAARLLGAMGVARDPFSFRDVMVRAAHEAADAGLPASAGTVALVRSLSPDEGYGTKFVVAVTEMLCVELHSISGVDHNVRKHVLAALSALVDHAAVPGGSGDGSAAAAVSKSVWANAETILEHTLDSDVDVVLGALNLLLSVSHGSWPPAERVDIGSAARLGAACAAVVVSIAERAGVGSDGWAQWSLALRMHRDVVAVLCSSKHACTAAVDALLALVVASGADRPEELSSAVSVAATDCICACLRGAGGSSVDGEGAAVPTEPALSIEIVANAVLRAFRFEGSPDFTPVHAVAAALPAAPPGPRDDIVAAVLLGRAGPWLLRIIAAIFSAAAAASGGREERRLNPVLCSALASLIARWQSRTTSRAVGELLSARPAEGPGQPLPRQEFVWLRHHLALSELMLEVLCATGSIPDKLQSCAELLPLLPPRGVSQLLRVLWRAWPASSGVAAPSDAVWRSELHRVLVTHVATAGRCFATYAL